MSPHTAPVNRILRFSSVDGDGNRTVVFLQGCNLDCRYCHNPETRALCTGCGDCVSVCPTGALTRTENGIAYAADSCVFCDNCIKTCTHDASPRIRNLTAEETYEEVIRQVPYIRGVTVSGGECTLYPEYLRELFTRCRAAGLETFADSNGTYAFSRDPELLAVTDGVLLDVKAWSEDNHRTVTGAGNETVLQNLDFLAASGKLREVRTVVVPGLVDAEETVRETARVIAPHRKMAPVRYKIIAFRPLGVRSAYRTYETPDSEILSALAQLAKEEGMTDVIIV